MLARYWDTKTKLGAVLALYGALVLLADALGADELACLTLPLVIIAATFLFARHRGSSWTAGMLLPGVFICSTAALAYGSLNWINPPSAYVAYSAFLLFAASWVYAIYRAFSIRG